MQPNVAIYIFYRNIYEFKRISDHLNSFKFSFLFLNPVNAAKILSSCLNLPILYYLSGLTKTYFKLRNAILLLILCLSFSACRQNNQDRPSNYYSVASFDKDAINVVVEIPAGTNHKIEYDPASDSFKNDTKEGKTRVINFLPYPGNYGFIPSTLMDKARGGDGDALDVLVIGEAEITGTVLSVKPIATLMLKDGGEIDTKLIAIPADPSKQTISPESFQEFIVEYDAARMIIETWFLNYKGRGAMELVGWQDDSYALREIQKWSTSSATVSD